MYLFPLLFVISHILPSQLIRFCIVTSAEYVSRVHKCLIMFAYLECWGVKRFEETLNMENGNGVKLFNVLKKH